MLYITFCNRFEDLADQLLTRFSVEKLEPFLPQQLIVPSTAVKRHIELSIADRTGICANVEFSFLGQWLWRQIARVVPVEVESPFAPEVLAWRVFRALEDASFTKEHNRLHTYTHGADAVMRLDLARRIAQLMEHYITYRPAFLTAWSANKKAAVKNLDNTGAEDELWQGALWRRLSEEIGLAKEHPSVEFFKHIESAEKSALIAAGLPSSAHVFCLPSVPPLYLEMLRHLSRFTQIYIYTLNPSSEYWFEIIDRKQLSYLKTRDQSQHHDVGNSLLARWGKQTQAHIDLLLSGDSETEETGSLFTPAGNNLLLGRLQNAILTLDELGPGCISLATDDRSVEFHVCHSMTRELEVLQDQLLSVFAAPTAPHPSEILIITPNLIETAPLIDAVFGTAPANRYIPYTVTGQPQRGVNEVARALDTLITLSAGRHPANAVFDFLMQEPVAAQFGLDAEELEVIRGWIEESGVRWAMSADERRSLGLPASERHTFADGLHRLYIAYATGDSTTCVGSRVGSGNPEGQSAIALGRFWRFTDELLRLQQSWCEPKDPHRWREALNSGLDTFIKESHAWAEDLSTVRAAIARLYDHMKRGGIQGEVSLEIVQSALGELLDDSAHGGVPSGKVTFASIGSLRNLPYRMICAIGLNDGALPTTAGELEFDLMALSPMRGDRQRRVDERNQFLDLILAARERLYLSYSGRSARDNSKSPPSVLVAELSEYLVRACSHTKVDEPAICSRLTVEHPLQPFSQEYFSASEDQRRRSFNAEYCEALRAKLIAPEKKIEFPAPAMTADESDEDDPSQDGLTLFFAHPLSQPEAEFRDVQLEQLIRFFTNPCRYLLRERLHLVLPEHDARLSDDEPFLVDWPGLRDLVERLLPAALEGAGIDKLRRQGHAGTELPTGSVGEAALESELVDIHRFAQTLTADLSSPFEARHVATLDFTISDESWRLSGAVGDLRTVGLIRWRYDITRVNDYLAGWITHLFICATRKEQGPGVTRWHSRDGFFQFAPYTDAKARLAELLELYREGLAAPLHFYPKSAWEYMTNGQNPKRAGIKWQSTKDQPHKENSDPAYRLALRGLSNPLDTAFFELATKVLRPLLDQIDDPRLKVSQP